jgi:hypothetical protein
MLFFPDGVTDMTTSTLLPHKLQCFPAFLIPALAETSVFDLAFPDMAASFQNRFLFLRAIFLPVLSAHNTFDVSSV